MKSILLATFSVLLINNNAIACNSEAIKTAQEIYNQAESDFNSGLTTSTNSLQAKVHLLEMKICQNSNDKNVCSDLVSTLTSAFDVSKKGYSVGANSMSDVLSLHTKLVQTKIKCNL